MFGYTPIEKHFQERIAEPQISPLRSPGFPVETRGFDDQQVLRYAPPEDSLRFSQPMLRQKRTALVLKPLDLQLA